MLQFEWDPAKAESNRRKHGIDFGEAATAFGDPLSSTIPDPEHSGEKSDSSSSVYRTGTGSLSWRTPRSVIRFESSAPARPQPLSAMPMSKTEGSDEMRDEYDFSGAVRGKYAERFAKGSNVIVLAPDVAEVFKDADAVNEALRLLAESVREGKRAS